MLRPTARSAAKGPKIIAAGAADVPEEVAKDVGVAIREAVSASKLGNAKLLSVRFVPSTRVMVGGAAGGYELLANATVEFGSDPKFRRKKVVESVVKIADANGKQSLREVALPGL